MSNTEIDYQTTLIFGDINDRVIESVGSHEGKKPFEVGYYNGDDKKKAIINVSCATGCPVGCNFCDLTDSGGPLTPESIYQQVEDMLFFAKSVDGYNPCDKPLKINFAKTGEPLLNGHIVDAMDLIASKIPSTSFKISTSMPNIPQVQERIKDWALFASNYQAGSVQLQISLISTSESFRQASVGMRSNMSLLPLEGVAESINTWFRYNKAGRTPNCSFLLSADTPCNPLDIIDTFRPGNVNFRIRPVVTTQNSQANGLKPISEASIENILSVFRLYSYNINTAGVTTMTEQAHALASNVTRRQVVAGQRPSGTFFVDRAGSLTPIQL